MSISRQYIRRTRRPGAKKPKEMNPYKPEVPYEDDEQATLVEWCDLHHYPRFRVPNETWTTYKQIRKNAVLGVTKGVPDLFVIVPTRDGTKLIAIEMKRRKEARPQTSKEQKQWIEWLNEANIPAKVCYGADEAINFIKEQK